MSGELVSQKEVPVMPELTMDIIKKYICPEATEQEIYMFLQLCRSQKLNPFLREAYLIKYKGTPATIVTGKETFTKRADSVPQYDGFKAGIIIFSNDKIVYREGSFHTSSEQVLGGWAEVYCKGKAVPFRNEVSIDEYEGKKVDGTLTKMWTTKRATMIRKIALVQSLREAFPNAFGGLYSPEEINSVDALPTYELGKAPVVQAPTQVKTPQSKSATAPSTTTPDPAPVATEPSGDMMIGIREVTQSTGEKDGKKWTKYHIKDTTGGDWITFDKKIAEAAKAAKEKGEGVIIKTETKGKYVNVVSMLPMPALSDEAEAGAAFDAEIGRMADMAAEEAGLEKAK